MKKNLRKNKIVLAIIVGAFIAGILIMEGMIYYSVIKMEKEKLGKIKDRAFLPKKEMSTLSEKETPVLPKNQKCENIPELADNAIKLATKIIDGDTFLIEGGYSVRILGINADEKNYPCYDGAKNKLEELILNQEVKLEKGEENLDKYCRYLRYVFVNGSNVSLELTKNGLAVAYFFPENIKYHKEISNAEKQARENKIGCKWTKK